jgi:ABC-type lipoprotein release transport system permease subunit
MKTSADQKNSLDYASHYRRDNDEKKVDIIELNKRLNQSVKQEKKANFKLVFFSIVGLAAFGIISIL